MLQATDPKYIIFGIACIIVLYFILKIIKTPLKIIFKIVGNGIVGVMLLFIANYLGQYLGFKIGINIVTALIAGVFGIPGVVVLIIFVMFL